MDWRTELLTLVERFCRATGRSESRIATIVGGSGRFFDRIRGGNGCSIDVAIRVKRWFHDNWPDGEAWPEGVSPPTVISAAPPSEGAAA